MEIKAYELGQEQMIYELVWEVFAKYEAPEYPEEGIQTFKTFIAAEHLKEMVLQSEYKIYCCFENEQLIGVIAFRNQTHISLLFVREKYHRQGIAKKMLAFALNDMRNKDRTINHISVNSSPYAQKIYRKMAFIETDEMQKQEGIIYIPMVLEI